MSRTSAISITRGFYIVARDRGKESSAEHLKEGGPTPADDSSGGTLNALPELMRRAVALGLSGFFLTEEAVRKAVGDTLPKDWLDFAVDQGERTRRELLDRLSQEIGRTLERADLGELLAELLAGHTVEVKAEFRLVPDHRAGKSKGKPTADDG
jgi:hypothetical protein